MSDSEVTVDRGATTGMYRMEYKGRYDFSDSEPTERDKAAFRKYVDTHKAYREPRYSGTGRGLTVRAQDGASREGTVVAAYEGGASTSRELPQ